jgi:hypothetical protein
MKNRLIIATFILMTFAASAIAQENQDGQKDNKDEIKTIFHHKKHSTGGYASLTAGYTQVNGKSGYCYGFNAACMIGHNVGIGIAGSGFSNDLFLDHNSGSNYQSLQGGYGGFFIEPVIFPKFPVHVSFPIILGMGGVAHMNAYYWDNFDYEYYYEESDVFFLAEPGLDIELNLVKHLRLGIGAKYRFTTATHLEGYSANALNGFSINMSLKFGKF